MERRVKGVGGEAGETGKLDGCLTVRKARRELAGERD